MLGKDDVLDDFKEEDEDSVVINGTWKEWLVGLVFGVILHAALFSVQFKLLFSEILNNKFLEISIIGINWEYVGIVNFIFSFSMKLLYLLSIKSWKQSFNRILLLSIISSILDISLLIIFMVVNDQSGFYDTFFGYISSGGTYFSVLVNIFLFLILFLLFRKKFRYVGITIIIVIIVFLARGH